MADQQYSSSSPSPEDFDAALNNLMLSMPDPDSLLPDLRHGFRSLSSSLGETREFRPGDDEVSQVLMARLRDEARWAEMSDRADTDRQLAGVSFPLGLHITGSEGELTGLIVELRDRNGHSAIDFGGYLETFAAGPVAIAVLAESADEVALRREVLFSRPALEEGIERLGRLDLADFADPDEYPYLLWCAVLELVEQYDFKNISTSDFNRVTRVDADNLSFILDSCYGYFLFSFELHPQHHTIAVNCRELEGPQRRA